MTKKVLSILLLLLFLKPIMFSKEYSLFKKNNLYGLITKDKKVIMPPCYTWINVGSNAIVCYKGREREIFNTYLELLFSDSWVNILYYNDEEIIITKSLGAEQKLLNLKTGKISEYQRNKKYLEEHGFRDNVELVAESGKPEFSYSIVDNRGNVLLTDIKEAHSVYTNGMLAVILKDGRSGFVNKKGKFVIETDFYIEPEDIGPRQEPIIRYLFLENYGLVKTNNQKWVQFDLKGKKKLVPENLEPTDYCYRKGLVPVRNIQTKKIGYMNKDFEIMIPLIFDEAKGFVGNYAVVKYENKDAIIDKKGNIYFCEDLR